LASESRLILFDEPLGALDALTRLEMQNLIERLWQQRGFTAILVTHDVEEAVALADRVLLMRDGEIGYESLISLPRPRDRSSAQFATLKAGILSRVLQGQ
jgi:sulfonate transport system ATP-binding protein